MVDMRRRVELFLDDLRLGGEGEVVVGLGMLSVLEDGALRL